MRGIYAVVVGLMLPYMTAQSTESYQVGPCLPDAHRHNTATKGTVRILWSDWYSNKVYNTVAAIVLADIMGYTVEMVYEDDPFQVYKRLHDGDADVTFEVWPASKEEEQEKYCVNGNGIDIGKLSIAGREGWYVPDYMTRRYPGSRYYPFVATEEGRRVFGAAPISGSPQVQDTYCRKAVYRCSRNATFFSPHCRTAEDCGVQLLRRTPTFSTGQNEQLITNLRLNMSMPYLGPDFNDVLWNAFAREAPLLFYGWVPGENLMNIPFARFQRVALPPRVGRACGPNITADLDGGMRCDWGWQTLRKVGRRAIESNAELLYFARHFDIGEADHRFFLGQTDDNNIHKIACQWVLQHQSTWSQWIKPTFFLKYLLPVYWGDDLPCAVAALAQIAGGLLLGVLTAQWFRPVWSALCCRLRRQARRQRARQQFKGLARVTGRNMATWYKVRAGTAGLHPTPSLASITPSPRPPMSSGPATNEELEGMNELLFLANFRPESDFFANDLNVPLDDYRGQFRPEVPGKLTMYWRLFSLQRPSFNGCLVAATVFALLSSGIGSLIQIARETYDFRYGDWLDHNAATLSSMTMVYGSFATLPTFVMVFVLNSEIGRWLSVVQVLTGQAEAGLMIHSSGQSADVAGLAASWRSLVAILGGCLKNETEEQRKARYQFYRLINLIHLTTYLELDERFRAVSPKRLKAIGLLTDAEDRAFGGTTFHNADVCISRLTTAYAAAVDRGLIAGNTGNAICGIVADCQGAISRIQRHHHERVPGSAVAVMTMILDILHLLFLVVLPLSLNVEHACFQGITFLGVFLLSISYNGLRTITTILREPFSGAADNLNVDAILSETELWTFWCLGTDLAARPPPVADLAVTDVPSAGDVV